MDENHTNVTSMNNRIRFNVRGEKKTCHKLVDNHLDSSMDIDKTLDGYNCREYIQHHSGISICINLFRDRSNSKKINEKLSKKKMSNTNL